MNALSQQLMRNALGLGMKAMAVQFLREASQAKALSRQTLRRILALNGATEWGRTHGLDGPSAEAAFLSLPLTTYQDYEPYVEREAAGEQGVLTSEPVTYFAVTSGTTGKQKLIPVTRRQTRVIMRHMVVPMGLSMRTGLLGPMRGRFLQVMTEQVSGMTAGGIPKGAATSNGLRRVGGMMERIWTSPMAVVGTQDQVAARYLHLLFALGEERLWAVVAIFPSTLLFTLRDLQARAEELLRDLSDGTITRSLDLPEAVRAELTARLERNPTRARALSALLAQGRFTVRDIWPEVGAVLTAGSGTFRFYIDQLQPYLGGVPVFSPVYGASEAAVGIGLSPERPGYIVSPTAAYYEFVPLGETDQPDARPLPLDQAEVGQDYEIVLTTYAGLTRYRLGDVVRVVDRYGEAPMLEFVERRGQVINVVGEKTSEQQVAVAFEAACRETGAVVLDYVITPDPEHNPARYLLLVEALTGPAASRGSVAEPRLDAQGLLQAMERHLRRTAPDYNDSRRLGELAPMAAVVLRPGSFERFRDARVASGASASQVKVPHVMPDPGVARRHFLQQALMQVESERAG